MYYINTPSSGSRYIFIIDTWWWTGWALVKKSARFHLPAAQLTVKLPKLTWSWTQWYRMSIVLDRFWVSDLLAIPTAHSLSQVMGVADWGYPSSARVNRRDVANWAQINRAAYSAAAAESTTVVIIVDKYATGALGVAPGSQSPRKKKPPALDLALVSDR